MNLVVRPATPADRAAVLALNVEAEALMSPMDHARLLALEAQSVYHRIVHDGQAAIAFLLAFDERADYDSPNYLWYRQRYPRFVYIDRNRRIGGLLYDDVFAFARERGVGTVAAEFYIEPFNEASSRFHARYGFGEVGTQWVAQGRKRVSLQIASVSRD